MAVGSSSREPSSSDDRTFSFGQDYFWWRWETLHCVFLRNGVFFFFFDFFLSWFVKGELGPWFVNRENLSPQTFSSEDE